MKINYEIFKKSILRYLLNSKSDYMGAHWDVMNIISTLNLIDREFQQIKKDKSDNTKEIDSLVKL